VSNPKIHREATAHEIADIYKGASKEWTFEHRPIVNLSEAYLALEARRDVLLEYYEAREARDAVPNTGVLASVRDEAGMRVERARAALDNGGQALPRTFDMAAGITPPAMAARIPAAPDLHTRAAVTGISGRATSTAPTSSQRNAHPRKWSGQRHRAVKPRSPVGSYTFNSSVSRRHLRLRCVYGAYVRSHKILADDLAQDIGC
jgi:hypothetical protein